MKLGSIKPPKGAVRSNKRLGMGPGSGKGKTAGKGHKGQKARSGGKVKAWFEGGQMPLQMRLPKVGFNSSHPENQVVNLDDLTRKSLTGEVTPETLKEAGLIRSTARPVKVLGEGEATGAVTLKGLSVSASAAKKIEAAGGSVEGAYVGGTRKKKGRRKPAPAPQAAPAESEAEASPSEDA